MKNNNLNNNIEDMQITEPIAGWINLYKPIGCSSFDMIRQLRKILNIKKIGHAGTLDPFAEGVLPIAIGQATKLIDIMQNAKKQYRFTLSFGEERDSDDITGKITATSDYFPSQGEISSILPQFTGAIHQIPPRYSALKVNGKRAYTLARADIDFSLQERIVQIDDLIIKNYLPRSTEFEVVCGKGTYIRSLGKDIALKLATRGYISALCRQRVGKFLLEESFLLEEIKNLWQNGARDFLLPVELILDDILVFEVNQEKAIRILYGQAIEYEACLHGENSLAIVYNNKLIALAKPDAGVLLPYKVFNHS